MDPFPPLAESIAYARSLGKPTVADLLSDAARDGRTLVQPRSGVGDHDAMLDLLLGLEHRAQPDVATITIDSYTRLLQLDTARRALRGDAGTLNGYPLVSHGWRRGRELNELVRAPLQVRHGSPDARLLFRTTLASGITSFEGGGISYNVPYVKNIPIASSVRAWQEVDRVAGEATAAGLVVDRELFGTLTAVLMPPSICLAVTLIEAVLAAAEGVRCISIAYPQGGHPWQDLAALRAIPRLAARYLTPYSGVRVHTVLHQFMGIFPTDWSRAIDLITYGALLAGLGNVDKVVTKSPAEARGIPTLAENAEGIFATRAALEQPLDRLVIDEDAVADELEAIEREVGELVEPILDQRDLVVAVADAFADGRIDVPFSASRFAQSLVTPCRDQEGAIRFADVGRLPFSQATRRRNDDLVRVRLRERADSLDGLMRDLYFFSDERPSPPWKWFGRRGERSAAHAQVAAR
ncbi:methylaspartate mutase [Micromonospora inyonensis]|uniref:Glutamate mutase subunit E n=1 Tax=Micromonospora inyonensis TaxID=47866 RepID=A0A1C6SNI6_9ACTN|nr:methylaspartate mutase [Micromonospora inyonensis]SCL30785.1 Glutamate mutase subunit E [Micromonospora inyonensis]